MITNDVQYRYTRKQLAGLESLIVSAKRCDAGDDGFRDLQMAGLVSQADDLREELSEYRTRRQG